MPKPASEPLRFLAIRNTCPTPRFSPDSRYLLTVSRDHTVRVWETATGEPITPPLAHDALVQSAMWHPEAREIVTVSNDGTVRVWDVSPTLESIEDLQREVELLAAHRLGTNMVW
jgi:WD40 repeat protein